MSSLAAVKANPGVYWSSVDDLLVIMLQLIENMAEGLPESDDAPMEFRHPLLDEALVSDVAGLPWRYKVAPE